MCLGVPGRVARWIDQDPLFAKAEVEFGGIRRICHMACVLDSAEGDYVLVHAGIAISRIDADAAERLIDELARIGEIEELPEGIDDLPDPAERGAM